MVIGLRRMSFEESERRGTCDDMCPKSEIERRHKERLLHVLEVTQESRKDRNPVPDSSRMVKEFTRSTYGAIDLSPKTLRTIPALMKTTDYLINEILPVTWQPFNVIYDFMTDRFRAIRQEIIIQQISGQPKIYMLEQMTLFHVYSSYMLCDLEYRAFDPVLNNQYLHECLNVLLALYDDLNLAQEFKRCENKQNGDVNHGDQNQDKDHNQDGDHNQDDEQDEVTPGCENQAAFEAIFLLREFGSESALSRIHSLPAKVSNHPLIRQIYNLDILYMIGNYYQVLKGVSSLPVITWMALHDHLPQVQLKYLKVINAAYLALPICDLNRLLCPFDDGDQSKKFVKELLVKNGFQIDTKNGEVKLKNKDVLTLKSIDRVKWSKLDRRLQNREFKDHVRVLLDVSKLGKKDS